MNMARKLTVKFHVILPAGNKHSGPVTGRRSRLTSADLADRPMIDTVQYFLVQYSIVLPSTKMISLNTFNHEFYGA